LARTLQEQRWGNVWPLFMWIKTSIFIPIFSCLSMAGLFAQSPYRIATFSGLSEDVCRGILGRFWEGNSEESAEIRHLKRAGALNLGNDHARLGPFAISHSDQISKYQAQPASDTLVHYVQILPGKLKFLRSKLTAFEVNIVLNQIRDLIIRSGLITESDSSTVFGFKSGRYNVKAQKENSEKLKKIIDKVEDAFREIQSEALGSPSLNTGVFNWARERLIAVGSGRSEIEAVIASRFSDNRFVKFSDVEALVREALVELSSLSERLKGLLSSNLATLRFISNGKFEKAFFDNFRQFQTQEDFIDSLRARGLTEGEAEELAGVAFRFFTLVDKFIPGTQYADEVIEQVPVNELPKDRSPNQETRSILIADVKGAGSDILTETWYSLEAGLATLVRGNEEFFQVSDVLRTIDISPAISRLREALASTISEVIRVEGSNLISYWVSGDEVLFFLKNRSRIPQEDKLELGNVRLVEEDQSSFADLLPQDRAYFREVVERSHKFIERSHPDLPLKMARADFINDVFEIHIVLHNSEGHTRPSPEQIEAIQAAVAKDLRENFPTWPLLRRIQIDLF